MSSSTSTIDTNSSNTTIQMLYFASARTTLNRSSESLSLSKSTFSTPNEFKAYLLDKHCNNDEEVKKVLDKSAISLNEEIVYDDEGVALKSGDVVAIIPPVSGG